MKKHNLTSGLLFTVLAFALASGFFAIPSNAQAAEWHIRDDATGGDCSLIGNWDVASKICTLTQDLNQGIIIDSNGITLDGNGHTMIGSGSGSGVYLSGRSGVTIKNLNVKNFYSGISLYSSSGNTLTNNTASSNIYSGISLGSSSGNTLTSNSANSNNTIGIYLHSSSNNNTLTSNNASSNNYNGIILEFSSNNTLTSNSAQENYNYDVFVSANSDAHCSNVIASTTGSGNRPIKYFNSPVTLGDETLSELILCNADGSSINNVIIDGSATKKNNGLLVSRTDNSNFTNIKSSNNNIGISLHSSSNNNTLTGNNANSNNLYGIILYSSSNNTLTNNTANSNNHGIYLYSSSGNTVTNNSANANNIGISLYSSSNNTLTNNTVNSNSYGIIPHSSNGNKIYNNNFINNPTQAYVSGSIDIGNVFNLAEPTGGNYWSNFDEPAEGCNDTYYDGFCDSPYVFNGGQDNLPWTEKDGWIAPANQPPTLSNLLQWDGSTVISEGYIVRYPFISFSANVSDPDGDQVKLQVELRRFEESFTGVDDGGILTSDLVPSGSENVRITRAGLSDGKYHWRARAIDSMGNKSVWQEFGVVGNVDFEILTNQSQCEGICITDINPKSGAPGITATIEGKNFNSGFGLFHFVYFGSNAAEIIDWEDNRIVVKVPFGAGVVDVKVSTLTSESNKVSFTYNEPFIDALQPEIGNTQTQVKIQGNDFGIKGLSSLFRVKFGKSNAVTTAWEDKEISTQPPSDYGAGENDKNFLACLRIVAASTVVAKLLELPPLPLSPLEEWAIKNCGEWFLALINLTDIDVDSINGEITTDVKVTTPAGESNTKIFTYQVLPLVQGDLDSPSELRIYDSQGRISGMVHGEVREEIPASLYVSGKEIVSIPTANDQYLYEVIGTANDTYGLNLLFTEQATTTIFKAIDIPIAVGEIHRYTIDWQTIRSNGEGAVINIDIDGDGISDKEITADNILTQDEFILQTKTNIDIDPDVINLKSKGGVITAYIELPYGFVPDNIDVATVMLNGVIPAIEKPVTLGDYDNDSVADLMVKFSRKEVEQLLKDSVGVVKIDISGEVSRGGKRLKFAGVDYVRIK